MSVSRFVRPLAAGLALFAALSGNALAQAYPPSITNTVNVTAPNGTVTSASDTDTLVNQANVGVTKTSSSLAPVVGANVTFTVTVTNGGPAPALAVSVADTLPAGYTAVTITPSTGTYSAGTWTIGTLANGASATLTMVATVNATGPYANTATVTSTTPDPVAGNNSATVTPVPVAPQLTMTKTASAASFTVGVPASYTLAVQNTGTTATTAAATITDTIPAGLTIGTLPAGCTAATQTVTCTIGAGLATGATTSFVIPVTPTASAAATVTNTASVSGGGDTTCPAAARCTSSVGPTPVNRPQLTAGKIAPASFTVGVSASYQISVQNTGTAATTAATTLTDTIPTGLTIGAMPAGCTVSTQTVTCTVGAGLAVGATSTFVIPVTPTLAAGTSVTNTVTASGGGDTTCPAAARCTATVGPTPVNAPQLTMTKTASDASFTVGVPASYTLQLGNTGTNATTAAATVTDTIPAGLTIGTLPAGCTAAGQTVTCTVGSGLAAGADTSFVIPVTPTAAAGPSVTNTATASGGGDPTCPAAARCTSTAGPTPVGASADVRITKTLTTGTPAQTGSSVSYQLVVTNAGPSAVVGATVSDTVPTQLSGVTWTCVATGSATCGTASGTGNVATTADIAAGAGNAVTIVITGTAPAVSPATIAANTATVGVPAGTTDPDTGNNSATVPAVPVVPGPIDAVDDDFTGAPIDGRVGGTTTTVFVNDDLGGNTPTSATVTTTLVDDGGLTGVSISSAGLISVPAATPAGIYLVEYRICETANPTNCDNAIATVVVSAAVIDAVDDGGNVANGAAGGTAVADVLVNDTLGGDPATLVNVTLAQLATTNPNVTLNPATGAVVVAPGTAAGTYAVTYEICEQLNPSNCDTAQAEVTVGAATIVATADSGTVANGALGGTAVPNVLVNDTLGGASATLANVVISEVSTTNPNVTLNPATGEVVVAPNTPAGTYTVVYRICEQLNPTNCQNANVTVTVGAALIDAVNDSGTVANGAAGGTAVPNVVANDTLGGNPATLATVTLTQVSTTNPNVTLNPATGAVVVAAGTPAGTYTVTYQICEPLNPTNCDAADVTVTVGAAAIDAVDDSGTVANGAAGGTAVSNVLVNDTLGAAAATLANVTLSQVSTTNPNVTLNPATGAVVVAAGTPAGTYTLEYRICEQLNPTNCDTAEVDVTVGAALIDAVDDGGTVANGAAGGTAVANVLTNDTLGGVAATLANVTLSQVSTDNPNVTLNPATGAVSVAAGTPAGTYTVVYQICEILNPTNCDAADVVVTVGAAAIDAVDDSGSVANGAAGGTAVADVLVNDTLGGAAATLANVTLTQVSTDNPNVTLNATTGAVEVAAGTAAGIYTVEYRICEQLNPTNCDTAEVEVTVAAAALAADDDSGTVADGAAGGTAVTNVLANDTVGGAPATLANVTLTQVSTDNTNVTLNTATGAVAVAPGTPAGTYTVVYRICEQLNPTSCTTAEVEVTVGEAAIAALDDNGTVANGAAGGTAVANVLVNDTVGAAAATLANVTLTQVSTDNPNVTLNPATGAVVVAAGTPAGTYTVEYRICEQLNPATCDTAEVEVTVGAALIEANDDAGTVANGAAGGTAVANVLVNDTLGGDPATLATVTLTQVSTTNPNVTLNPATGEVTVAPATPAGTYTVEYRICEQLNPTNCATAEVVVTVGAALIEANDDAGTVANGAAGGTAVADVLVNDELGGDPATLATVTLTQVSTTNPNVTLNPATGEVTVAPATPAGTYTVEYRICEQLNPTNCATAEVVVTVNAALIEANDDAGTVANGAAGGTAVANVLVNDELGGDPATLATVTLSQVSTTNPNVTLNPATGAVEVAAGTPAGTYTVEYRICEQLNPANCDTAEVEVTVGAAVIDAIDDTGTVASGATGGTAVANVLVNDTLGGDPATLATVTLAQVSTTNPGVTLNPATGEVVVAAGTAAGTYTVVYEICEILNPANCDTAEVEVTVGLAPIDAIDDAGTVASGASGGTAVANVLVNDTLGGAPATLATVTLAQVSTTNPNVTLDPATGAVVVAPGTPSGAYTLVYRICEILNPANCDTAQVSVQVGAATIDAVDDNGTVADGGVGGVAVANVLVNDALNGVPATLANVTLAQVSTSNPNVTLDPATGAVNVAPGVAAGTYTLVYRICEILNPANCDTATVTVTVTNGDIAPVAVDDTFAGNEGAPITGNAANNDTPGNLTSTYTLLAQPASGTVVMQSNGTFTYTPVPGFVGTVTFPYRLCDADGDCDDAVVTVNVTPVQGKLRLQKTANSREVNVGQLVSYTLTITNIGALPVVAADVVDVPPAGFAFVPGSVVIQDADNAGVVTGTGPITFAGIDIPVGGTATIRYFLRVGAGLVAGEYTNEATVYQGGVAVSNSAAASVVTGAGLDPDFEQTRVWGKVFDDRNGNGWQDEGELGIPGVRLATVEGLVAETDAQGRYHFEGLVVSNQMRGQNFVVKVDKSTLPEGAVFTTANPLLRRITPAVPTRFDFGVTLPAPPPATETVSLELGTVVFAPGSREIRAEYAEVVRRMAEQVRAHDGGDVSIETVSGEEALAFERAVAVRDALAAELGADAGKVRIDVLQADQSRLASVGTDVQLGSVLFDTDRATIRAGHEALLDSVAKRAAECGCAIVLTGHADVRGGSGHNQALALRRADAVRQAIEARLTPEQRTRVRVETEGAAAPGAGQ